MRYQPIAYFIDVEGDFPQEGNMSGHNFRLAFSGGYTNTVFIKPSATQKTRVGIFDSPVNGYLSVALQHNGGMAVGSGWYTNLKYNIVLLHCLR